MEISFRLPFLTGLNRLSQNGAAGFLWLFLLHYLKEQWTNLVNYLLNRRPELSNVLVERSIKPFVGESLQDKIPLTGADEDEIFKGINNYFRRLAARQIKISILCHTY